jgi:hypothetical protein
MFYLIGHYTDAKRMLKLRNTPRLAWDDLLMARVEQQIRQHAYTKGFLDPSLVLADLVRVIVKSCVQRAYAASCSTRSPSLKAMPCMTSVK